MDSIKKIMKEVAKKQATEAFTWLDYFEPKMPDCLKKEIENDK